MLGQATGRADHDVRRTGRQEALLLEERLLTHQALSSDLRYTCANKAHSKSLEDSVDLECQIPRRQQHQGTRPGRQPVEEGLHYWGSVGKSLTLACRCGDANVAAVGRVLIQGSLRASSQQRDHGRLDREERVEPSLPQCALHGRVQGSRQLLQRRRGASGINHAVARRPVRCLGRLGSFFVPLLAARRRLSGLFGIGGLPSGSRVCGWRQQRPQTQQRCHALVATLGLVWILLHAAIDKCILVDALILTRRTLLVLY
mmetsp:Transcript_85167/g.153395  ORF Transcript_85167/g.153395 Transcript_85167/m.153395 type:complete len:258 (-) Transcript_85167:357-1130(-)